MGLSIINHSCDLSLRLLETSDAEDLANYLEHNRDFHGPWDIEHSAEYFHPVYWANLLTENQFLYQEKRAARIGCYLGQRLIGVCHIAQVLVEPICQAEIGYHIDAGHSRQGLMFEALCLLIPWAFHYFELERLVALVMLDNQPSQLLLKKLGFIQEGCLREYLLMRGQRVDHLLFSLLREDLNHYQHFVSDCSRLDKPLE
ncbi:GNAT family N-acetyltransferase [Piscirickettsia salmonis]|uniref:GNAT family N-acetyltransferase n=1 Tax=Piscirickettsia salmonis TaxID=1238 RepID=UPI0007C8A4DF|nr:putative ribosomal N-acetyltransferase YdaF [Piscirickettsiaceae bacterium NZ-RLO1]